MNWSKSSIKKYVELVHCTYMLQQFAVGCSNVTLNPLHTANSKNESHFNLHKLFDSVPAVFIEFFHKAASHALGL